MYYEGVGEGKDLKRAFELYNEVAETGDGDALFMVGRMYLEGLGVEQNAEKGFEYFGKAARAGNDAALELVEDMMKRQNAQFVKIDGLERIASSPGPL
jgi:hypothetical protein